MVFGGEERLVVEGRCGDQWIWASIEVAVALTVLIDGLC